MSRNQFGLSDSDFRLLNEIVVVPFKAKGAEVYIFGSRVRGTYHPYSDIDVLYSSPNYSVFDVHLVRHSLEESNMTVKVDLVSEADLTESYRSSILAERVRL